MKNMNESFPKNVFIWKCKEVTVKQIQWIKPMKQVWTFTRLPPKQSLLSSSGCSNKGMEHLYSMKCKNKVPLYDLLLEMLDAHHIHRPERPGESWPQAGRENSSRSSSSSSGSGESSTASSTGPSVLQYGGSRADCAHTPWDAASTGHFESLRGWEQKKKCSRWAERGVFRKTGCTEIILWHNYL